MIITCTLTILLAIALSFLTTIQLNRISIIILIYSSLLSYNSLYPSIINEELGIYGNLFNVSTLAGSFDIFIYILGAFLLILNENPFKNITRESLTGSLENRNLGFLWTFSSSFQKNEEPSNSNLEELANKTGHVENSYIEEQTAEVNRSIRLRTIGEYPVIILFSLLGGILLMASNDLVSMYLSLELQSFSVYILACLYRESESSTFSGLKYFLLGGLSSGIILLGSSLVYAFSGLTNFDMINNFLQVLPYATNSELGSVAFLNSLVDNNSLSILQEGESKEYWSTIGSSYMNLLILQVAIVIVFIGFLFKIAAAPFHNWAPDVYDGVPTKITAWLTIVPKISILIFLLILKNKFTVPINESESLGNLGQSNIIGTSMSTIWILQINSSLLILASSLSLVIGTVLGLTQYKLKRMLAYSTVSHVGFMLLALAIFSEEAVESLIFYIIQYSITNINLFFIVLGLGYIISKITRKQDNYNSDSSNDISDSTKRGLMTPIYSAITNISQMNGHYWVNPLLAFNFAMALFSMAGIPPFPGFFAKQMVLSSAIQEGYLFVSLLAILASVIGAAYYLRVVKCIFFDKLPTNNNDSSLENRSMNHLQFTKLFDKITIFKQYKLILNSIHCYIISLSSVFNLFFILNPSLILNSVHLITLHIFSH